MSELINRYATMDAIPAPTDADEAEYYGKVCDAIEAMPTIEAEPVRHGRWIPQENCYRYEFKCSRCGHEVEFSLPELVDPRDYEFYLDKYCGGCGARMDATDTNVGGKGGADNG